MTFAIPVHILTKNPLTNLRSLPGKVTVYYHSTTGCCVQIFPPLWTRSCGSSYGMPVERSRRSWGVDGLNVYLECSSRSFCSDVRITVHTYPRLFPPHNATITTIARGSRASILQSSDVCAPVVTREERPIMSATEPWGYLKNGLPPQPRRPGRHQMI